MKSIAHPSAIRCRIAAILAAWACFSPAFVFSSDWRTWRGPSGNGVAADDARPPTNWSETESVVWKAAVPGRGHSTPIVVGNLVVVTTADEATQAQMVLAFDRRTGAEIWRRDLHRGNFTKKLHRRNSHATPSPCSDGERIFAVFLNGERVFLHALDLAGKELWRRDTGAFRGRYGYGYAPSPVLAGARVIVASEFEKDGYLAAYDRVTGKEAWRVPRNATTSYSTPAVATVAGRDQLFLSGNDRVTSYDPATGKQLWWADAVTRATIGTLVWEGDLIFGSGGFPDKETAAVRADGSGEVVWTNNQRCYEQSLLVHDGHVYAINDGGIAYCWRAADGKERWVSRLGGPVSASPVLADGKIYFTSERGITWVVRADPERFELIAENRLGEEAIASPVVCGDSLYLRVATHEEDGRREWLYRVKREN